MFAFALRKPVFMYESARSTEPELITGTPGSLMKEPISFGSLERRERCKQELVHFQPETLGSQQGSAASGPSAGFLLAI